MSERRKLKPIKTGSLRDQVKNAVREGIFQGRLLPGDSLRELDLARDLRVSQSTVREALMQLEQSGLICRVPNKETIVTRLSQQDLRERIALRHILEAEAAALAAERVTASEVKEMQEKLEALSAVTRRNDYYGLSQADLEFHRWIWRRSGNLTLCSLLENLTAPMFAFVSIVRSNEKQNLEGVVLAHEPIATAIAENNAELARRRIREHIERSYREFLEVEWEDFRELLHSRRPARRLIGS